MDRFPVVSGPPAVPATLPAVGVPPVVRAGHPPRQRTATLPVASLLPADSPRLRGQNARHVRLLAGLEAVLPPIVVHAPTMRVIDGMHRLRAAELRGDDHIEVRLFDGDEEEAFLLAVMLNSANGLPLDQADRLAAAARIIAAHPDWSDRRIGKACGLVAGTVAAVRKRSTVQGEQSKTRVGRDGRARPVDPAEGRMRAGRLLAACPGRPLRELAELAGISLSTAKDVRDRVQQGRDPLPPRLRGALDGSEPAAAAEAEKGLQPVCDTATGLPGLLRRDPSMRTDAGRTLIHLLSASHAIGDRAAWHRLAQCVPRHRRAVIARAARACAERWTLLANVLEEKGP
ncbi:ParB-like chromosome segregation protein Spo0J [Streptomyces olivoverticillatus]|uniref:ParB-like chromosome segregation protein Spo0J n=1 Tax=Streptomyces olivoverticillatus TaxID=66427 RepID=A0A7W7PKX2_9ACTN|nr:ParB/RepB/Spo0J family partition protein [Streptomyces olivoverticillatus]MBB4893689.1 ParB-like chromosome segregation protein Spo0J [Streptomyces olivoverticillatus]